MQGLGKLRQQSGKAYIGLHGVLLQRAAVEHGMNPEVAASRGSTTRQRVPADDVGK